MAIQNIHLIHKKHRNMINSVDLDDEGVGVWLERPYIFSVSEASCTFFPFELFEDDKDPFKSTVKALNECIKQEATKIDPLVWDKG